MYLNNIIFFNVAVRYNLSQTFQQVTDPQAAPEECNVLFATRKDMEMSQYHMGAFF